MNSRLLLIVGFCILAILLLALGAGLLAWRGPHESFTIFNVSFE